MLKAIYIVDSAGLFWGFFFTWDYSLLGEKKTKLLLCFHSFIHHSDPRNVSQVKTEYSNHLRNTQGRANSQRTKMNRSLPGCKMDEM